MKTGTSMTKTEYRALKELDEYRKREQEKANVFHENKVRTFRELIGSCFDREYANYLADRIVNDGKLQVNILVAGSHSFTTRISVDGIVLLNDGRVTAPGGCYRISFQAKYESHFSKDMIEFKEVFPSPGLAIGYLAEHAAHAFQRDREHAARLQAELDRITKDLTPLYKRAWRFLTDGTLEGKV